MPPVLAQTATSITADNAQLLVLVGLLLSIVAAAAALSSALAAWRFYRRLLAMEIR